VKLRSLQDSFEGESHAQGHAHHGFDRYSSNCWRTMDFLRQNAIPEFTVFVGLSAVAQQLNLEGHFFTAGASGNGDNYRGRL